MAYRAKRAPQADYELVKQSEFSDTQRATYKAYKKSEADPVTIGFGHTGLIEINGETRKPRLGDEISGEYAHYLFDYVDSKMAEDRIDTYFPGIPLTDGMRGALFSFCFNVKLKWIDFSYKATFKNLIRAQQLPIQQALIWFVKYRNKGTIFELGLTRRRLYEAFRWDDIPPEIAHKVAWSAELFDTTEEMEAQARRLYDKAKREQMSQPVQPPGAGPTVPPLTEPPVPAVTPDEEVEAKPVRKTRPPTPVNKKRSPMTTKSVNVYSVAPEDVAYGIEPSNPLKPLEESDRAIGFVWQQIGIILMRAAGVSGIGWIGYVANDPVFANAAIALIVTGGVALPGLLAKLYGNAKRRRGEEKASQGLF